MRQPFFHKEYEKAGFNPVKEQSETAQHRRLWIDDALPLGVNYAQMITGILGNKASRG